jgi:hypothetical protein
MAISQEITEITPAAPVIGVRRDGIFAEGTIWVPQEYFTSASEKSPPDGALQETRGVLFQADMSFKDETPVSVASQKSVAEIGPAPTVEQATGIQQTGQSCVLKATVSKMGRAGQTSHQQPATSSQRLTATKPSKASSIHTSSSD